jgi:hypothetical protein
MSLLGGSGVHQLAGRWLAGAGAAESRPAVAATQVHAAPVEDHVDETGAMDDAQLLTAAADRLEELAARTTGGCWTVRGLLASRPEVVAELPDGTTEHVAEARGRTAEWIRTLSPALAGPLAAWLRAAAGEPVDPSALAVARLLAG